MTSIRTSAPGKVIICGEYAVLEGAPAVAMAINRRATVVMRPQAGDSSTVTAPGYAAAERQFAAAGEDGLRWQGGAALGLLEAAWRRFAIDRRQAFALTLDSSRFSDPDSGAKYGLGSSAALMVALTAALSRVSGHDADTETLAMAAHRDFQGGSGSGVDVATSCRGGVMAYSIGGLRRSLPWPEGIGYAVLWSGRPADTVRRIRQFAAGDHRASATALGAAASAVLDTWTDGGQLWRALRDYVHELQRFSAARELGIFAAGHQALTDMADGDRVVYKPCGAGGGDVGIALARDREALQEFVECAVAAGFSSLDVAVDADGVRHENGEAD